MRRNFEGFARREPFCGMCICKTCILLQGTVWRLVDLMSNLSSIHGDASIRASTSIAT